MPLKRSNRIPYSLFTSDERTSICIALKGRLKDLEKRRKIFLASESKSTRDLATQNTEEIAVIKLLLKRFGWKS